MIALDAHYGKLVSGTEPVHELTKQLQEKNIILLKLCPMYTFWSDGAKSLRVLENTLRFVQECGQRRDDIVGKQTANVKDTGIDPEEGEREAENADNICYDE
jgi:hypothetical protein